MNRLLVAAVLVVSSACVTNRPIARQARPLAHQGDAPLAFSALGARYQVPVRLGITDHDKEPGIAWFDFIDQDNGCSGGLVFLASSERSRASAYVTSVVDEDVSGYHAQGIDTKVVPATQPMLGEKADVRVAQLSTGKDRAAKAHFALFVPEQQLVVMGNVFCADPGFMDPQLHLVGQLVDSQQKLLAQH